MDMTCSRAQHQRTNQLVNSQRQAFVASTESDVTNNPDGGRQHQRQPLYQEGDNVWLPDKRHGCSNSTIGGTIRTVEDQRLLVNDDDNEEYWVMKNTAPKHMHATSANGVDDLRKLHALDFSSILHNLQFRYNKQEIYTYSGSILVAVNPNETLPIYSVETINKYRHGNMKQLPPHIYAIGNKAYNNMIRNREDQCLIISGESGAGKTENAKFILQFLATHSGQNSDIEQILNTNPVMESFGNAMTLQNDNSSRFGKYIELHFNNIGKLVGAEVKQYLLEKSRIVNQVNDGITYHIFYAMLNGLSVEEKAALGLTEARDYHYLNQRDNRCENNNDLNQILTAMKSLSFSDSEILEILQVLAAILHVGNIKFTETNEDNIAGSEIQDMGPVKEAARLLKVDVQGLAKALITTSFVQRGENITIKLNREHAKDVRDALSKGLYGLLFTWIVVKINKALYRPQKTKEYRKHIGVFDVFGFENLDKNSFEQLCINYANEALQQVFVMCIFKIVQEEYKNEELQFEAIGFEDNQKVLDQLANVPMNIFAMIDDETKFPKATDETLAFKVRKYHETADTKPPPKIRNAFGVKHFAGVVYYVTDGFLDKNRETFSFNLLEVVNTSSSRLVGELLKDVHKKVHSTRKKATTVGGQYKASLKLLIKSLEKSERHFVRCFKANDLKQCQNFDRAVCERQLLYTDMLKTVEIQNAGYPHHYLFKDFVKRYHALCPALPALNRINDWKQAAKTICEVALPNKHFQLGKTKVFLKDPEENLLQQKRDSMLTPHVVTIQKAWRGWYVRRQLRKETKAIVIIQAHWRWFACRLRYSKHLRDELHRKERERRVTSSIVTIQKALRGWNSRKQLRNKIIAATTIQAYWRCFINRDSYVKDQLTKGDSYTKLIVPRQPSQPDYSSPMPYKHDYSNDQPDCHPDLYTLEDFSYHNFCNPGKFWRYSKKPIYQPLLKDLEGNEQMARQACQCYSAILMYMGDHPTRRYTASNSITDEIFAPPVQNMCLRDELFCQVIKQLTFNYDKLSEERGWELMWLITSCFAPSPKLQREVFEFLRSSHPRYEEFQKCSVRLEETQRNGPRKYPPHQLEVDAIQTKSLPIAYKVLIPCGASMLVEVNSRTKVDDIAREVARTLGLNSTEGFTLNLIIKGQHTRLPEGYFVFDIDPHLTEWYNNYYKIDHVHQIMVMKNVWTNTVPGDDITADELFHYSQEMKSYMLHYLNYTTDEAAQIAAYIYRANFGNNDFKFHNIPRHLKRFVPNDLIPKLPPQEWYQKIKSFYYRDGNMTCLDAKIAFLELLYRKPTFGSQYFPVKQTDDRGLPQHLVVAINQNGLTLIEEDTREILVTYPLIKISSWLAKHNSICLEFGESKKLYLRTNYGRWIENLLNSYIEYTRM